MLLIYFFLINQNLTDSISLKVTNIDIENVRILSVDSENTIVYSVGDAALLSVNIHTKKKNPISLNDDISHIARGLNSDYFILWDSKNKISHFDKFHQLRNEYTITSEQKSYSSFVYTNSNRFLIFDEELATLSTYSLFDRKILHEEDLSSRSTIKLENTLFRDYERNYVLIGENQSVVLSGSGFYRGEMKNIGNDFYKSSSANVYRTKNELYLNQKKLSVDIVSFDVSNGYIVYLTNSLTLIRNKCD